MYIIGNNISNNNKNNNINSITNNIKNNLINPQMYILFKKIHIQIKEITIIK